MLKRPLPTSIRLRSAFLLTCALLVAGSYAVWMTLPRAADAQVSPARDIGVVVNEAVTALNSGRTEEAKKVIATIDLTALPAPARSHLEMVLFNIALQEKRYDDARNHLDKAVSGLPAEQAARVRYQGTELLAEGQGQ